MKRIFSLILAFVAVQMMSLAAVHTYKVTSPNASGEGSLYDIVSQINELPQKDEAVVTFNLPSSAQNTIDADKVTFIIKRVISIQGGTNKVTIKSSGFYFSDTLVKEISNINFTAESGSQGLRFDYPMNLLSGCSFSGYSISILAPLSTGSIDIIQNCSFSNADNAGIYSYGNIGAIKGCTFANCSKGIAVYDGTKFQPTVNVINDCKFNGCETPLMVHAESVSEISKVVADGGTSSIYSNVETFSNCDFSGSVSFYNLASNSKIDNCHFKSNLSFYSSDLGEMSRVVADTAIQLSSANIFVLRNSKLKCGISGSSKMDGTTRFVKDTITNPKGHGIYLHNDLISIDSCIISDCGENGIYYTKISELKNSQIYNCAEDGVRVYSESVGLISNCKIHDCGVGVMVNSVLTTIESCEIYDNTSAGIHVYQGSIKKISNCSNISGSPKGIHCAGTVSEISNCSITDNEYGIYQEYGTIGVIKKCNILDNGDGGINCPTTVSLDSISHCVISGSKVGILYGRVGGNNGGGSVIEGCVIGKDGTNKLLDGNDIGVQIGNMSAATLVDNVISGNTSYGIYIDGKPHMDVKDNYIGTNSSLQNLGNGVGVYSDMYGANEFSNNVIAYNIIGLKEMGTPSLLYDNTFIGNSEAGVYMSISERSAQESRFNTTKFLNSPAGSKAVDVSSLDDARQLGTPVITGVTAPDKDGYVYVSGTVDDMNGYDKVSVSLFASDGRSQDAVEFLASDSTDVSGAFKIKVKKGEAPFFSVIAIAERYSYAYSEFSEVYNAFFTTSFFVKTKRNGTGDGSSWTNAMSGEDFARILPLVADGTKFYVAAGKYQPIYDNKGEVPTDITDKEFFTTKCVSIYGGFPSTAKGTDLTRDPAKYLTTFDGDLAQNNASEYDYDEFSYGSFRNDDVRHILRIQPVNSGSVEISGIVFENSRQNSREGSACLDVTGSSSNKVSCNINKCTFSRGTAGLGLYSCSDSKVSECLFLNNETGGSFSDAAQKSTVRVEKNTFVNIESWHFNSTCKKAIIVNNTFAGVPKVSNSINADTAYVMNNTFNGEIWSTSTSLLNLVGNIINGDVAYMGTNVKSSHNVYLDVNKDSLFIDKSDVLATAEELDALLADKPIYDDHTLVIPLQDDKLTSGKSIRFPLSETMVTEDQRGVARLDNTCAGAYEINCANDTTLVRDTIYVGGKFMDVTYTQVGVHDSIFENLKSQFGCDSVVMHILLVKPDPTVKEYYVKTKREGKGDGSSWENAMNGEDFAAVLPLAPDGATFYVAEGRYVPKYGENLSSDVESPKLCYEINSSVTIRGGYPAGAKTGAVSDPLKYETTFDGDFNGDDIINESLETDGQTILSKDNVADNLTNIFYTKTPGALQINIEGVRIKNSFNGIFIGSADKQVQINTCEFFNNSNAINISVNTNLNVKNVSFVKNYNRCLVLKGLNSGSSVHIDSVSFDSNYGRLIEAISGNGYWGTTIYMSNVSANKNVGKNDLTGHPIIDVYNEDFNITNSEFKENYGLINVSRGGSQIDSSAFERNIGFVTCVGENGLMVKNSSFKENKSSGKLLECNNSSAVCVVDNTLLDGNEASTLISVIGEHAILNLTNSVVENNEISGNLVDANIDSLAINHVTFNNNNIGSSQRLLSVTAFGHVSITSNNFSNNVSLYTPKDPEDSDEADVPEMIFLKGREDKIETLFNVEGNTFWENQFGTVITVSYRCDSVLIANNTIVSNKLSSTLMFFAFAHNSTLYNNTIIGNVVDNGEVIFLQEADVPFIGNIIVGNVDPNASNAESIGSIWSVPVFYHNILPYHNAALNGGCEEEISLEDNVLTFTNANKAKCAGLKNTKDRNKEILTTLFEGSYDDTKNLFTPILKFNGGFTPTLALKTDRLSDGTSIRFPLSETMVTEDQRGVARLDSTCMGAYELGCGDYLTEVSDTIFVGGEFLGKTYDVIGRFDSIPETSVNSFGCEETVIHTLFVKPDPSVLAYYVKTKSEGKGDGSSWENAMSGDDFAACLPLAPDGATFYVAEGRYVPKYGENLMTSKTSSDLYYQINSSINIIGGYPKNASGNALSQPDKYITLFDGDFKNDDVTKDSLDEYDGTTVLKNYTNTDDDSYHLFMTDIRRPLSVSFEGVTFSHTFYGVLFSSTDDPLNLNCKNVRFENIYEYTIKNDRTMGVVSVDYSRFDNCEGGIYVGYSDLSVKNSQFNEINGNYLFFGQSDLNGLTSIVLDSVTVSECSGKIQSMGHLDIRNSNFESINTTSEFIAIWSSGLPGESVNILNSKFSHSHCGRFIYSYAETVKIKSSLFDDFVVNAEFYVGGDLEMQNSKVLNCSGPAEFFRCSNGNVIFVSDTLESNSCKSLVKADKDCSFDGCLIRDNNAAVLSNQISTVYPISFSDCQIIGNYGGGVALDTCFFVNQSFTDLEMVDSLSFTRTVIDGNKFKYLIHSERIKVFISDCDLENNVSRQDMINAFGSHLSITGSSLVKNKGYILIQNAGIINSKGSPIRMNYFANNTFVGNEAEDHIYYGYYSNQRFYNNTFLGNKGKYHVSIRGDKTTDNDTLAFVGNIFFGNEIDYFSFDETLALYYEYNIMPLLQDSHKNLLCNPGKSNIIADYRFDEILQNADYENVSEFSNVKNYYEEVAELYDGTIDKTTGLFTPVLKTDKGIVPYVALKADKLPDGTSIRFPLSETMVTEDQRGVARLDSTCMGAYEINCLNDTTYEENSIWVGDKFLGVTYASIGRYDDIVETITEVDGCEKTVVHTLFVKPDPSIRNYYVKTKREGKGDGSSWENAMDGDDFAACLPMAPNGATFYVAEGRYVPKYGEGLSVMANANECCYEINSSISIIGGYPASAAGKVTSNPDKYKTIFDGDLLGDDEEKHDGSYIGGLYFDNALDDIQEMFVQKADLKLQGVDITGCNRHNTPKRGPIVMEKEGVKLYLRSVDFYENVTCVSGTESSEIYIDSCRFVKCIGDGSNAGAITNYGSLYIRNSYFNQCYTVYYGGAIFSPDEGCVVDVENTTFDNCYAGRGGAVIMIQRGGKLRSVNSTYVNNFSDSSFVNSSVVYGKNCDCEFYNNTFLSNKLPANRVVYIEDVNSTIMVGNVFESVEQIGSNASAFSKNNIYTSPLFVSGEDASEFEENDIVLQPSDLSSLFEGQYDTENNTFKATLKDNGGFTPTIALKSDTLPDGTSIRFPLTATTVTEDQTGAARLDSTCMGAVEFVCLGDAFETKDTINLGDSYTFQGEEVGKAITRAGVYHYSDTLKTSNGCDSIISLTLAVRPELLENGYFVKVKGTGNGEDWENAMSAAMFDTLLPLFPDGAKVFIAEGTYKSDSYAFEVNSSISLTGGFPADAVTGAVSDPENYTTTLYAGGKYNDDDMSEYTYSFYNFDDNKSCVLNIRGDRDVEMYGLTIKGAYSCDSGAVNMENASLTIDRCVFKMNVATAIKAGKGAELEITDSYFTLNFGTRGGVFNLDGAQLDVKRSLFEKNIAISSECGIDSIGGVAYMNNTKANIENSTITGNLATKGAVFAITSSDLKLTNNTIVGNNFIAGDNSGSVIYSDSQSDVDLFANIIVGNKDGYFSANMASMTNIHSDYNIMDEEIIWTKGGHDMMMAKDEIASVMDVESYDAGVSPNLRDVGGYTKVIPVITSSFSGGKVICVERDVRKVDVDQRGINRKDTSCVGAYEFPTYMNYYVKTQPHGDGSGRDWANAMGDTTFAMYFPIVPANATFHVAEGVYHAYNTANAYNTTRPVNVIGSYPPDAQEGAVANASKYTTVLSSDYNDDDEYIVSQYDYSAFDVKNLQDDQSRVMSINSKLDGHVYLYGLRFVGSYPMFRGSSAALTLGPVTGKSLSAQLDSCEFLYDYMGISSYLDTLNLVSCRFDSLAYSGLSHYKYGAPSILNVDGCSFTNLEQSMYVGDYNGNVIVSNSTFNNVFQLLQTYNYLPYGSGAPRVKSELRFYNNTMFDGKASWEDINFPESTDIILMGNVFNTRMKLNGMAIPSEDSRIVSDYNLYIENPDTIGNAFPFGEHDILVEPKDVDGVIAGSLKENKFIATSKKMNDENITCVVELLDDKLATGQYIRLPKEESVVEVDQIGSARHSMSCMGAFEIDCKPDTFFYFDTIQIGNQFRGIVYDTVGNYNVIGEDSVNVVGCPLAVVHKLYVTPSFEGQGYYVKTERSGRGTGADWENAMNGADMVYGITQVPDNAVFYVAQGNYNLDQLSGSSVIDAPHAFSIIGGYKKNPSLRDVPNVNNKTILASDTLNFIINVKEPEGDVTDATTVGFYNLYLNNISLKGAVGRDVTLDSCAVRSEKIVLSISEANNVKIKDVSFDGISGSDMCMNVDATASVRVENSTINNYQDAISAVGMNGDLTVVNSTFTGNKSHELIKSTHVNGVTYLYNNTIAGNNGEETLLSLGKAIVKGNIFLGNSSSSFDVADGSEIAYNVLSSSYTGGDETNVKLSDTELPLYLDGSLDATNGIFTANLKDNGGFTPTVALLNDSFPDHSLARFEKEYTIVDFDQRGIPRLELLCYGAYELYDGVRDTVVIPVLDSICLGSDYSFGALSLETSDMNEGETTSYDYFVKGVLTSDTLYQLSLVVVPVLNIQLDDVMASPTLCHGSGNGAVKFSSYVKRSGSMDVIINNAAGKTVSSEMTRLISDYQKNDLPLGKYTASLVSNASCVVDTSFSFEVTDRDSMQAEDCADTLYTTCANEPTSQLTIPIRGFHSSATFYIDDTEINALSANAVVEYDDDADFTAQASIKLSAIDLGSHNVTAIDACGKKYDLKKFEVLMSKAYEIAMDEVDYRKDSLKCGLDLAYAKFHILSGTSATFSLTSDKGYNYTNVFSGKDTTLSFDDLGRGDYRAVLIKNLAGCSDSIVETFSIKSQEPLLQSLTVNGVLCADANIKVDAQGGRGAYTYHWTYPDGTKHDLSVGVLSDVNAGDYICVVEDGDGCFSDPDTASLKSEQELSALVVDTVYFKDITCITSNNGTIVAKFSSNDNKQSVTCSVTNLETNEISKATATKQKGELKINTLPAGKYSYDIYYGSAECRMDTNGVKGTFEIHSKSNIFKMDELKVTSPQTCLSSPNAIAEIDASGWEDDYKCYFINPTKKDSSYRVMKGEAVNGDIHFITPGLNGGSYIFRVYDACGSSVTSNGIDLPTYDKYEVTEIDHTDSLLCAKEKSGEIIFSVKGGIPSVAVPTINDKKLSITDEIKVSDLGQGTYRIAYGPSNVQSCPKDLAYLDVRIAGPDSLKIEYLLSGNCPTSKLSATVTGESAPYTYVWNYGDLHEETEKPILPFEIQRGETYSLSVTDAHQCDTYTEEVRIPDASELPGLKISLTPEAQKCHNEDNGSLVIKPSLTKATNLSLVSTVSYVLEGTTDTISVENTLRSNGDNDFVGLYNVLKPGVYYATVRLGGLDCDMGVAPATGKARVDSIGELQFSTEFNTTPMTCTSSNPNGTATFDVAGWVWSNTLEYYEDGVEKVGGLSDVKPEKKPNYVGGFQLNDLRGTTYVVHVEDICHNEIFGKFTVDQFEPKVEIDSVTHLTCYNNANGSFLCKIYGWTPKHKATLVCQGSNYFKTSDPTRFSVDTINGQPVATFRAQGMHTGKWNLSVVNECGETLTDTATVNGFDYYNIELDKSSIIDLKCPYDTNGVIVLNVTGGIGETELISASATKVNYPCLVPSDDTTITYEEKRTYQVVASYDSAAVADTLFDTIISGHDVWIDTILTYPRRVDTTGEFMFDTIWSITQVPVIHTGYKTATCDSLSHVPYRHSSFVPSTQWTNTSGVYTYVNGKEGSYHFIYRSTAPGCHDSTDILVRITRPVNVEINNAVLPISCTTSTDGEITILPFRGPDFKSMMIGDTVFVGHDTLNTFKMNKLYTYDRDENGNRVVVTYPKGKNPDSIRIDELYIDDIETVSWSREKSDKSWEVIDNNIVFPDSSDLLETAYYKDGYVVTTPVYANTPLEPFWFDHMGDYFYRNTITVSNLAPGRYSVKLTDHNACVYTDTFKVEEPERPLKIDSVVYDPAAAYCDPSKRQILAYGSGGWGSYNFTFSDTAKVTTLGEQSDGYRGGEATYYSSETMTGWGVSQYLDPGLYTVVLLDEKGCMVQSEEQYSVKSKFKLHIDTTKTHCPEDPTAPVIVKFIDKPKDGTKFDVYEITDPCRTDTLDDCRDSIMVPLLTGADFKVKNDTALLEGIELSARKLLKKTHGLFVYEATDEHCGTYVQGTVDDSIPSAKASKKDITPVTCNGAADGSVEFFVNGGSTPYYLERNDEWNSSTVIETFNTTLNSYEETVSVGDPSDTTTMHDTTVVRQFFKVNNMKAGSYAFTLLDSRGCRSVLGSPETFDTLLVVKEPDPLTAVFNSSVVCPEASLTKGGNIFFQNVSGGTKPYIYSYAYRDVAGDDCDAVTAIETGELGYDIHMYVTDQHECKIDTVIQFKNDNLIVDSVSFWASTWRNQGDILALIDVCGPDENLDSVSYVFKDKDGKPDPRVELLDKRMYIYDIANGEAKYRNALTGIDTKTEASDAYFRNHFNLLIDEELAKHISFIRLNDTTQSWKNSKSENPWAEHTVLMKAYFKGCEYQYECKEGLKVAYDGYDPYEGGVSLRSEIVSMEVSPNPFETDFTVTARFSSRVDADLYFYNMNGNVTAHPIKVSASELVPNGDEFVATMKFTPAEIFGDGGVPATDAIIVFLKTKRDAISTIALFHDADMDK